MMKIKIKKYTSQKGFVLLFAVVLSAIIFAITLGMTDIALKQLAFTTSAKSTNEAFFAADTGAECALYWDLLGAQGLFGQVDAFGTGSSITTKCADLAVDLNNGSNVPQLDPPEGWTFVLSSLGTLKKSCAIVNLKKVLNSNDVIVSTIISKGYNVGDDNCESDDPNRVERVLELRY